MPDIEAINSYESASYDNVMEAGRRIIEDGEYFGPIGQMNLQDSLRRMQQMFLKARFDRVPQAKLDMMLRWIDDASGQIKEQMAEQQPQGQAAPPQQPAGNSRITNDVQRIQAHRAATQLVGAP